MRTRIKDLWKGQPRLVRLLLKRSAFLPAQIFGVVFVAFMLVRLLPGDPALLLLGSLATPAAVDALQERLGLDLPIWQQFLVYISRSLQGDLGTSFFTNNPVAVDLLQRAPATLELIILATLVMLLISLPLAIYAALKPGGMVHKFTRIFSLSAGSIPDFWLGLLLIYFLFFSLQILPAPAGRIDVYITPPPTITGFYTIDSILTGNWEAFRSSSIHLFMPVLTIAVVNSGAVLKMTQATFASVLKSPFIEHARACGLPTAVIVRYALRNSLPPIITTVGFLFGFFLGAAVVTETVFAWGGLGQYAVDSVINSDYAALQGFVLVAGVFTLLVYLAVDVLYALSDPRIEV